MEHNLLYSTQMRLNDVMVSFLVEQPSKHTHALTVREKDTQEPYLIPLSLQGVTCYFPTRKPSAAEYEEYENEYNQKFDVRFKTPECDPHYTQFVEQAAAFTDSCGRLLAPRHRCYCQVTDPTKVLSTLCA
jgi:hypothetical protein